MTFIAYPNQTGLGPYEFITWIVGVDNMIVPVILLVTFAIMFISTMRFGPFKAGLISIFVIWIMTVFTSLLGWTSYIWFTGASVILVLLIALTELFDNAKN